MKKFKELTKKQKIIMLSGVLLILSIIIGVTYAFFATEIGSSATTDSDLTSKKSTQLLFNPGAPISLRANTTNFAEGAGSLTSSSTSTVIHIPSTDSVNHIETYNVFFNIPKNNFVYTVDENTPEVILSITDNDNNPVTELTGLNYVSVIDSVTGDTISGFDITTKEGLIKIKEDVQIVATYPTETLQEWSVKITFVNLDTNQKLNEGKELSGDLVLQSEPITISSQLLSIQGETNSLMQHTAAIETSAGDNNYRYSGGNDVVENYVCFGSDEAVCPKENLYRILGIYNIEGEQLLKIIKAHPIDKNKDGVYDVGWGMEDVFQFDSGNNKDWEGSNITDAGDDADVNIYLNNTYLNEIPIKYQEMIEPVKFKIGGISNATYFETPKNFYVQEQLEETTQEYKIGLMYPSDYLYGASEEYWGLTNFVSEQSTNDYRRNEEMKANNWMYSKEYAIKEYWGWIINPHKTLTSRLSYMSWVGDVSYTTPYSANSISPVSYLKSSVIIESGIGTETDPFRLTM